MIVRSQLYINKTTHWHIDTDPFAGTFQFVFMYLTPVVRTAFNFGLQSFLLRDSCFDDERYDA